MSNNLLGRFTGKNGGGSWGRSPRPTADDLPEWAQEFQGPEWAAAPNPQASKSRQQRRARLLMRLMLASLPVSLFSCLLAVQSSSGPSEAPEAQTALDAASVLPKARGQAQIVAQQWLAHGGLLLKSMTWQDFRPSHLTCDPQPEPPIDEGGENSQNQQPAPLPAPEVRTMCEEHTFRAHINRQDKGGTGEWVTLTVTIHPLNGSEAGVYMTSDEPQSNAGRTVWEKQPENTAAKLNALSLPTLYEKLWEWAVAWTKGENEQLHRLAGIEEEALQKALEDGMLEQKPWFGLADWEVIPNSQLSPAGEEPVPDLRIVSNWQIAASQSHLVTIEFDLARGCQLILGRDDNNKRPRCDDCPTPATQETDQGSTQETDQGSTQETDQGSTQEAGPPKFRDINGLLVCADSMSMTADLHAIINEEDQKMTIVEYGAVGTIDPDPIIQQYIQDTEV